jgi:hypothetical protein
LSDGWDLGLNMDGPGKEGIRWMEGREERVWGHVVRL